MPTKTFEPRDAGAAETGDVSGLFRVNAPSLHDPDSCGLTCAVALTIACGISVQISCVAAGTVVCS